MAVRIAVVNHDAVFLRLVNQILNLDGYECIMCTANSTAHEIISNEKPDLIVLDTWLENREAGWVLLQTLLLDETTNHIPVIITTSEVADFEQRAAGRDDLNTIVLLRKPFTPDQLLAVVGKVLKEEGHDTGDPSPA